MDERLVYLFEANRRKSIRLRRIAIALAILLVLVICIAVILAALVIQLKLESLVRKTTTPDNEVSDICAVDLLMPHMQQHDAPSLCSNCAVAILVLGSTVRPNRPTRVVFAINMVGKKNRRLKRAIDDTRRFTTSVVRSVVAKRSSDGTEFALQLYSVPKNTSFTFFSNAYKTLKLLDTVMYSDYPYNNPNQTDAILQYRNEYGDSDAHPYHYYYVLFAADPSTYRDSLFYERDMKESNEALAGISSARTQAVVVGDKRLFSNTYATVISNNNTIDEIIAKINRHLSSAHIDEGKAEKPSLTPKSYPSSVLTYSEVVPSAPTFENNGDDLLPLSIYTDHTHSNDEAHMETDDAETSLPGVAITTDVSLNNEEPSHNDYISPLLGHSIVNNAFAIINIPSERTKSTQKIAKPTYLIAIPPTLPKNDSSRTSDSPTAAASVPKSKMRGTSKNISWNLNKSLVAANHITPSHTTVTDSSQSAVNISSVKHFGTEKEDDLSGRKSGSSSMSPREDMEEGFLNEFSATSSHASSSYEESSRVEKTRQHTSGASENQPTVLSVRPAVRTSIREPPLRHRFRVLSTSTEASVTAPIWPPPSLVRSTTVPPNVYSRAELAPNAVDDAASHSESANANEEGEIKKQFSTIQEPTEPSGETSYLGNVEDLKPSLRNGSSQGKIAVNPISSHRGETPSTSRHLSSSEAAKTGITSESLDGRVRTDTSTGNRASHSDGQNSPGPIDEQVDVSSTMSQNDLVNGHHNFNPQEQSEDDLGISSMKTDAMPESSTDLVFVSLPTKIFVGGKDNDELSRTSETIVSSIPDNHSQEKPNADIESLADMSRPSVEGNIGKTRASPEDPSSGEESVIVPIGTASTPRGVGFDDSSLEFPDITGMLNVKAGETNPADEIESSGEPSDSQEREAADSTSGMNERSKENLANANSSDLPEYSDEHESPKFEMAWSTTLPPTPETAPTTQRSSWIFDEASTVSGVQLTDGPNSSPLEKQSSLKFNSVTEKGAKLDNFSAEVENGGPDTTSVSISAPSGQLEESESAELGPEFSESSPQPANIVQHSGKFSKTNHTDDSDEHDSNESFSTVTVGQEYPQTTNRYIATALSPETHEQQFDNDQVEIPIIKSQPVTEEMNTSGRDTSVESTAELDHGDALPIAVTNQDQDLQHRQKQSSVTDGVLSTPAGNSFTIDREISTSTQPQQTFEDTTTAIFEHRSVTIATPHTFEVSMAGEDSLEGTGSFTASSSTISVVSEDSSEIIDTGVRPNSATNHGSNVRPSSSLNDESVESREEISAQVTGSTDMKGANEITFVNMPPTSGEFFEIPRTEPTEPLVNVENRRAFIEARHRTMRVWPSGKLVSETVAQNLATSSYLEKHSFGSQKEATVRKGELSTRDSYSHTTETTSQTSLLSFFHGGIPTSQEILSDDNVIGTVHKLTVNRNSEHLDSKTQDAHATSAENESSGFLTYTTPGRASGRSSGDPPASVDRTKFQIASTMSHGRRSAFDGGEISHRGSTTLATLSEQPIDVIISSTSQASPVAEDVRTSEGSRLDDEVQHDSARNNIDEPTSGGSDAEGVSTQITSITGDGDDSDITTTSVEGIVDQSDIPFSSPSINSGNHIAFVTQNSGSISHGAEGEHIGSRHSTTEAPQETNEALKSSDFDITDDEFSIANDRKRLLTGSTSASFEHSSPELSDNIDSRVIHKIATDETIPASDNFGKQTFVSDERTDLPKGAEGKSKSLPLTRVAAAAERDLRRGGELPKTSIKGRIQSFSNPPASDFDRFHVVKAVGRLEDSGNFVDRSESLLGNAAVESAGKSTTLSEARIRTDNKKINSGSVILQHASSTEEAGQSSERVTSVEHSPQLNVRKGYATLASKEGKSEEVAETSVPSINSETADAFASSISPLIEESEGFARSSRRSSSVDVSSEGTSRTSPSSVESLANSLSEMMLMEPRDTFDGEITSTEQSSTSISLREELIYPCVADLIVAIDYEPTIMENRDKVAQFLRQVINNWTLSDNAVRVAVVSYGLDDGVGIYSDNFGTSQAEVTEALRSSFESNGGGVGVVYPLTRLFKTIYTDYSAARNFNRFDDQSNRREHAIRNNTRVVYLLFSDSSNTTDIQEAAASNVCNDVLNDCRVLTVGMKNAANLSSLSHPTSATMRISNFTETSLDLLNSFIVRNMCN